MSHPTHGSCAYLTATGLCSPGASWVTWRAFTRLPGRIIAEGATFSFLGEGTPAAGPSAQVSSREIG